VVLLVAALRASIAPVPGIRVRGLGLGAFVRHALPLTMSGAILQVNVIADRAIASLIAPGAVSALRYAEVLIRTPITAIAPAWSAALYPAQVRAAGIASASRLGTTTGRSIAYAVVAFVPVAILAVALAPLAVEVAYGRGEFGTREVAVTAGVVAGFGPLILVMMVSPVLVGAHNARRRGGVLLATGIMNVIMNVTLDVVLGAWLGVAGIALASSITGTILVAFLARRLARAEGDFPLVSLAQTTLRAVGAIAIPAVGLAAIAWSGIGRGGGLSDLLLLVPLGVMALIAYALTARALGIAEVSVVLGLVAQRMGALGRLWSREE
jgi:putative peptidoglycan lipid II flippase